MSGFDFSEADSYIDSQIQGQATACSKGCSWCCHQLVVMTNKADGERMLELARQRLSDDDFNTLAGAIREQAEQIAQLPYTEAEARAWPCPFLRDRQCLVYEVRPIACRSVFSSDAETCKAMMQAEQFSELSTDQQRLAGAIGERALALQIAVNDRRPVTGAMELRHMLAEILATDS